MSAATMNEMERLRRERDEARAERDALAAHVERLREAGTELADLMDGVREGDYTPDSFTNQPMQTALSETPTTSLARLKAEWQAEALAAYAMNVSESYLSTEMLCAEDVHDGLLNAAARLRRRAQESTNGHH